MDRESPQSLSGDLRELLCEAMERAAPEAEATDLELTVVAERGIEGVRPKDRERIMNAIASNQGGAASAAWLHGELRRERATETVVGPDEKNAPVGPRRPGLIYRFSQIGWGIAAVIAVFSGIQLLQSTPEQPWAPIDHSETPIPSGSETIDPARPGVIVENGTASQPRDGRGAGLPMFLASTAAVGILTFVVVRFRPRTK